MQKPDIKAGFIGLGNVGRNLAGLLSGRRE